MSFIELKDIVKSYFSSKEAGFDALKQINLDIKQGEFTALMGESGSGKTSLLNILGLVDQPSSGVYLFDGQTVSNFSEDQRTQFRKKNLGFIFQFFNLLPTLNVLDNVALPLHLNASSNTKEVIREKLAQVGIAELIDRSLNTLSGGQLQRVAIARAIVHNPKFILADEPTGNLDSKTALEILELLKRLNRENNITIVMATHSKIAANSADKIIYLADGKLVTD
jgi:ABC-type lipoprotein export system ATPase subunit